MRHAYVAVYMSPQSRPLTTHHPEQQARRDGIFAGLSSGLVSGTYGTVRFLPLCPLQLSLPGVSVLRILLSLILILLHLAILGSKLFRLNRNATILCGVGERLHTAFPPSSPVPRPIRI